MGFRMITLASESQALRKGAAMHLSTARRRMTRCHRTTGDTTERRHDRQVALVTGAARGQGAAIVARLLADGFRVAACDR